MPRRRRACACGSSRGPASQRRTNSSQPRLEREHIVLITPTLPVLWTRLRAAVSAEAPPPVLHRGSLSAARPSLARHQAMFPHSRTPDLPAWRQNSWAAWIDSIEIAFAASFVSLFSPPLHEQQKENIENKYPPPPTCWHKQVLLVKSAAAAGARGALSSSLCLLQLSAEGPVPRPMCRLALQLHGGAGTNFKFG